MVGALRETLVPLVELSTQLSMRLLRNSLSLGQAAHTTPWLMQVPSLTEGYLRGSGTTHSFGHCDMPTPPAHCFVGTTSCSHMRKQET